MAPHPPSAGPQPYYAGACLHQPAHQPSLGRPENGRLAAETAGADLSGLVHHSATGTRTPTKHEAARVPDTNNVGQQTIGQPQPATTGAR